MNNSFEESASLILKSKKLTNQISKVIQVIIKSYKKGGKVVIFGNGGSAADSQHFAAELIGRYKLERQSLPAISLTTDTSILTALGNDYGFDYIFSRQCETMVKKGDIVIAISTSGKSKNVINAISTSKKNGAITIGLTGSNGGDLRKLADMLLIVDSKSTPKIQEVHRIIIHMICELVEESFKK
ncbi:MAG: D-sedoheptulose 7-phosphate isomerase [Thaumarchaeota archaeon]|nr:D-sedoheptulose 7-phosphate isomerase [Nitrososphaerota archaeon]MBI3641336.1 D-sedoheptulose 7-phosphate isomerase [Nitrososphaerota archaeon]